MKQNYVSTTNLQMAEAMLTAAIVRYGDARLEAEGIEIDMRRLQGIIEWHGLPKRAITLCIPRLEKQRKKLLDEAFKAVDPYIDSALKLLQGVAFLESWDFSNPHSFIPLLDRVREMLEDREKDERNLCLGEPYDADSPFEDWHTPISTYEWYASREITNDVPDEYIEELPFLYLNQSELRL